MKLSGFLIGGLVGAAAVTYMSKKRPGALAMAANAMSDICTSIRDKSVSKIMDTE